jgi:wobble nucleotide-excising tRNase
MLKEISRLKAFGVFADFSKVAPLQEFGPKNIIYGWNYSGKTTLSRFMSELGSGTAKYFPACKFSVMDGGGVVIADTNRAAWTHPVAVFNSDFIEDNLGWDGKPFTPILLLGEDSIDAQKKIVRCEEKIALNKSRADKKRADVLALNASMNEARTAAAKTVRQTLGIDPYTAVHLNQDVQTATVNGTVRLTDTDRAAKIRLANTPEADKLKPADEVLLGKSLSIDTRMASAKALVGQVPNFSKTISYLNAHADVSRWVEEGMPLHAEKSDCEFCGNTLPAARMEDLRAHFSKDFSDHRTMLAEERQLLEAAKVAHVTVVDLTLDSVFRAPLPGLLLALNEAIDAYNGALDVIKRGIDTKAETPYSAGSIEPVAEGLVDAIYAALEALNTHIRANNALSDDFPERKKAAILAVRLDFAQEFIDASDFVGKAQQASRWEAQAIRRVNFATILSKEVLRLRASINQAQRGREEINRRIVGMLGTNSIEISVVSHEGEDRFQLTRRGEVARNLSDGERTAVAFSFFLTKLGEIEDLSKAIVYIDDPISSLDANHIFQVFAIMQAVFFKQEGANKPWETTCRQLFVSTHNFDFFLLLKKLPGWKNGNFTRYFLTKRLTPESSTLINLPAAIDKHTSEYHYLFSILHKFHTSADKQDIEVLLALPNAVRRFLELYTYAKLPISGSTVDTRSAQLFGTEEGAKIVKLLHYFSHLESVDRLAANSDVISDIAAVVDDVMAHLKADNGHYDALAASLP